MSAKQKTLLSVGMGFCLVGAVVGGFAQSFPTFLVAFGSIAIGAGLIVGVGETSKP